MVGFSSKDQSFIAWPSTFAVPGKEERDKVLPADGVNVIRSIFIAGSGRAGPQNFLGLLAEIGEPEGSFRFGIER